MATKDAKIAEDVRAIRKHVQESLFGLPYTDQDIQKSIEDIRQVRTATHHLFPQASSAGEAHAMAHGEVKKGSCESCELPEAVKKRISHEKCITCEPPLYEMPDSKVLRITQTCQYSCRDDFKAMPSPAQDEFLKTHSNVLGNPPNRAMIHSNEGINSDKYHSAVRSNLAVSQRTSFTILATSFGTVAGQRGLVEVDKFFKRVTLPPAQRPSTYVNLIGGAALFYLGAYGGFSDDKALPMIVAGSMMLTKILQYTEEYVTAPQPQPVPTQTGPPVTGAIIGPQTGVTGGGLIPSPPSTIRFA